MTSEARFLAVVLLQYAVLCAVFVALCDLCRRLFRLDDLLTFCAAILAFGVIGYVMFWIAIANYALFGIFKIAVLAGLLLHFGAIAWRHELTAWRWLAEPLLYTTVFALIVVTLGFSDGGFDRPAETAQNRFSHPLPVDNIIPLWVANALKAGRISSPLFGDWLMSDRPPLQAGLYLLSTLRNTDLSYLIVAAWLQASYLLGVWLLAATTGIGQPARRLVLLSCCLLPTAIINTFFVWPKMLTVSHLLPVFALLLCRKPADERECIAFGLLIGGLTALAALGHGSSLFALFGFGVAVVLFWAWPPLKTLGYGLLAAATLYVPWMIYQSFDPPANRLLKWHFAGVVQIDNRSFLTALRDAYGSLSWHDFVQAKLENVARLIGVWPSGLICTATGAFGLGAWNPSGTRGTDFFHFLPSLHFYALALPCAFALLTFMPRDQQPLRAVAFRILVAILATLVLFVLVMFIPGSTVNHQGTYALQVLATIFAFMVLSSRTPLIAIVFIALQTVTISATYAFSLRHDPHLWPLLVACVAASLALVAYSLIPLRTGRAQ